VALELRAPVFSPPAGLYAARLLAQGLADDQQSPIATRWRSARFSPAT
jgi:hypothetical protein